MDMKPIYTTKFFEDCDDCCVCAVIFEDGKAVNIIDDLEKKGITGTKALEEARTGWQYAAPFVPDIVWKQTAEEKANETLSSGLQSLAHQPSLIQRVVRCV